MMKTMLLKLDHQDGSLLVESAFSMFKLSRLFFDKILNQVVLSNIQNNYRLRMWYIIA
ncbi:hypothetical protein [Photorhabdus cinerea]|uniref:hypothetical protein n=1 Tax=Photorhabdus cinerea TaxID=471575 RepID=UPI0014099F1C|nr:hypothetical protein [Photorhabdus cinerea]